MIQTQSHCPGFLAKIFGRKARMQHFSLTHSGRSFAKTGAQDHNLKNWAPVETSAAANISTMHQPTLLLSRQHQMPAPILLPALLVRLGAERLLLAEAGRRQTIGRDASRNQRLLRSLGTAVAECHVVLGRSALVAVPFDQHSPIWMLIQELRVLSQRRSIPRTNLVAVVIEVRVADVLIEQLLIGKGRLLRRGLHWRGTVHRHTRRRFLRSARTARR